MFNLYLQYDSLHSMFGMAVQNMKCHTTRELNRIYGDKTVRPYLLFLFPILRDMRIITKEFQLKKGDNLAIFQGLKEFFLRLAKRILKPEVIENNTRNNSIERLMNLNLDTDFCLLPLDQIDFGQVFLAKIENMTPDIRIDLKNRAKAYMKKLVTGMQSRLKAMFATVEKIEPFDLPGFFTNPPTVAHLKKPFFKTDEVSKVSLEYQIRGVIATFQNRYLLIYLFINFLCAHTLALLTQCSVHPTAPVLFTKTYNFASFASSVVINPTSYHKIINVLLFREKKSTSQFWIQVYNHKIGDEFIYRELARGVLKMLCLPISNAEVERSFSAVTHSKSWRRNKLDTDTLCALLRIRFGLLWLNQSAGKFMPPKEMLNFNSSIYDKLDN